MIKALLPVLCVTLLAGCREPLVTAPPETPPETFSATEISGTLSNWSAGEAFVTLSAGYSVSSGGDPDTDTVELAPPLYQSAISAAGAFSVELETPDASSLLPLGCTLADPQVGLLGSAVASTVATPTRGNEVLGFYANGDPQGSGKRSVWLYVAEAYKAKATCEANAQSGLSAIDLTLVAGWNQVIWSATETGATLTSGAIPTSFIWSEFL